MTDEMEQPSTIGQQGAKKPEKGTAGGVVWWCDDDGKKPKPQSVCVCVCGFRAQLFETESSQQTIHVS